MIELPLIFVAGFLGSSHCIGMCGPFALLLGTASGSGRANLTRQVVYSSGRLFTYSVMGAVAGYCGLRFATAARSLVNVPAVLAIAAGLFLVYQGLTTAGVVRWKSVHGGGPCLASGLLSKFLKSPARTDVFLAGLFTGLLPCGLVYGFVGLAASTQDVLTGGLVMFAFGLGTAPVMIATGSSGQLISTSLRKHLFNIAAWCIVLAGVVSIGRGVGFIGLAGAAADQCPLCP